MKKNLVDWKKEDLTEDWEKVKNSDTIHTIDHSYTVATPRDESKVINLPDWNNIITFDKKFIDCRECGKEFGMVVYQSGTEVDFECINCYNEGLKDGV